MSVEQLLLRDEARSKWLAGATALTDAVRVTSSPRSVYVLADGKWTGPLVCDGGVIVKRMNGSSAAPRADAAGSVARGFDAAKGRFVGMFAAGIVDPTKVVRIALENAVSVAGTSLLAESTSTEAVEQDPKHEREPELI